MRREQIEIEDVELNGCMKTVFIFAGIGIVGIVTFFGWLFVNIL